MNSDHSPRTGFTAPAKKQLGQHFLADKYYVEKIVMAVDPKGDDRLVEIGPGQGAITFPLLRRHPKLTVIEFDRDLIVPLTEAAARQPVPADPPVKDPKDFVLIGSDRPKLDTVAKSTGAAVFTMDVYRDGMLTVVVAHPPKFGATVASFDDKAALAVKGVEMVRQIPSGVAVYATNTYAALKGRDALTVTWDEAAAETRSTAEMFDAFAKVNFRSPKPYQRPTPDRSTSVERLGERIDPINIPAILRAFGREVPADLEPNPTE